MVGGGGPEGVYRVGDGEARVISGHGLFLVVA